MSNSQNFIDLVSSKIGCGYVWGGQGQILTQDVLNQLINTYGREHYYFDDGTTAEKWLGYQVFDCSGLIVWTLQKIGLIIGDYNTDGLLSLCEQLSSMDELQAGDLLFKGDSSSTDHVGIYVGSGYTIHARSTAVGVVKTSWEDYNKWSMYGRLNSLQGGDTDMFTDISGHWAEKNINDLVNMGIINGYDNGTFKPDNNITRAEAATLVLRAIKYITEK